MSQFIDRRLNGKNRSTVNRQRFIRRFKQQIKDAVSDAIQKRSITDMDNGERIIIPRKDISEPRITHGSGGRREFVLPGNKEYSQGDHIARPPNSSSGGDDSQASNQGEGKDDFSFYLTKEEFVTIFFEDLALPDMIKTRLAEMPSFETVRVGFSSEGSPPNLNILRSFRNALGRRLAFKSGYNTQLQVLLAEKNALLTVLPVDEQRITEIDALIEELTNKKQHVPFLERVDLRFSNRAKRPKLTTQAVMFCIMDVSGSMDEAKKDIAKRFFILLYLFLKRNYKKIHIVFIRHHTTAKEVDEQEFFYSRETGGTVVSSALELMQKIMQERFPTTDWNIYAAQASDGDNWNADSPLCGDIIMEKIMPYVQYFAYIEIMPRHHQSLWRTYLSVEEKFSHFSMRSINSQQEIYPVFHDLFKRKNT